MLNETIAIYAIIGDLLKAIRHDEDCRHQMRDRIPLKLLFTQSRITRNLG